MSVIIKEKGVIKMYTKGADSIIKKRLSDKSQLNLDQ
jgi:magnesium-transporting ATPase (P-type)